MTTTYFWFAPSSPMPMPMATLLREGSLRWQLEGQPGVLDHGELLAAFEFRTLGQRMHDAILLIAPAIVARGAGVQALAPRLGLSLLTLLELRQGDAEMAEAQEMPHLVRELPVAVVAAAEALAIDQDGASLAISRTLEARAPRSRWRSSDSRPNRRR